ncbi:MAG: 3'-5' exonuclease [Spirochaetaceae bacterium]|nr:MAG: 3'-5' exonuclease [Spirochaetaceae bacterium]
MDMNTSLNQLTCTAFDFETTGLHPGIDKIVEFGAVQFVDGKMTKSFEALCNPGVPIHPEASRVSGITDNMLVDKPSVKDVLLDFMDFIGDSVLIAHNAGFDLGFLRAALLEHQLPDMKNLIIDTMIIAQRAFPGQKSYSLQNLVSFLGIPPNTAHRARDDAYMCMKLFLASADALSFMGDISIGELMQ